MSIDLDSFDPTSHTGSFPSPCIGVCAMNAVTEICIGCQRTLDEIVHWSNASEMYKRTVWVEIKRRMEDVVFND